MGSPPAERGFLGEDKQPLRFKKVKGASTVEDQIFEYKCCALTYIKAINEGFKFKLGCNVEGFGSFDDIVVEYLDASGRTYHICVQLKRKERQHITAEKLMAESGNFSLIKHYESYIEIEKMFKSREQGGETKGSIDECLFIIYTNADVEEELKSDKTTDVGQEVFLNSGGYVLKLSEEKHKNIYEKMKDKPGYREFLSRYRIMYKQANEKEMDCYIIPPLQEKLKFSDSERELTCQYFCDSIKAWWQKKDKSYFLQETNLKENDPLEETSEKVRRKLIEDQRKSELEDLGIKYKEPAITYMKQLIDAEKAVLLFAPGISTTLTAAKIHQMLSATKHIILNLQQLIRHKSEVMLAWKNRFDVLVLESQRSTENLQGVFNEISIILNECGVEKRFIFIADIMGNTEQISALRRAFSEELTEEYDYWKFTDMVTESRTFFLEKKVTFQGLAIQIKNIVKESDFRMFNALDLDSMSLLLANEKPVIGVPVANTLNYYIDRTLESKNRYHHVTTVWRPKTLLEGEDRIILITDEPGMGKSTLLTHLAKKTQELHPDVWILMVSINNYTSILNDIKANGFEKESAIKLLTEAAQIKETDRVQLEKMLFNYIYNSTGNMAVLIDGLDEVSPNYTEEVLQILRTVTKTKIRKIWVTSRNSMRDQLEEEFQCQSYSLLPFSVEDQKSFLVQFWNQKDPNAEQDYIESLATRVFELSFKHLSDKENHFLGIPLVSVLLAEVFEENLEQCELPENINLFMLSNRYVKKKWDIYRREKINSNETSVYRPAESNELYEIFINNHKAAALKAILPTHHLEKLNDKDVLKKVSDFLQKIDQNLEKTGIITDVIEGRPVFQHRTLAEYFVALWFCDDFETRRTFLRDHLFESEFSVVSSMVDRILADKWQLHEAVINSNIRRVAKLLKTKDSITQKDHGGRTPLHVAVSCRNPNLIRLLLEHGADVSSVDKFLGFSPVQYAFRMDDWETLSLLMEKRPEIREQVLNEISHGRTGYIVSALRAAARYGHTDLLQYLIRMGHFVNTVFPGDGGTLLHEAARGNQSQTVWTLVDLGANCDIQDSKGRTVLHVSAETGSLEVAKFIVERQEISSGEDEKKNILTPDRTIMILKRLKVHDKDGNTPLHLAAAAGNTCIVRYFISAGSDVRSCNTRGEYPLTLAARYGKHDTVKLLLQIFPDLKCEEIMISALTAAIAAGEVYTAELLLKSGAPVSGGENEKPIHVASRMGDKENVNLLLQNGASLKSRTDSGNTALHLASETGQLILVKYLVEEEGYDLNTLNYENETPLHLAAGNGRDDLVTYFLENGCNINAASANDATCLHVACANGHYTIVECLLRYGAEVNAMNSADQTPLHIAASRGETKIFELLILHNANFSLLDKDSITALLAASINEHQDTLLHAACESGQVAIVQYLCEHGALLEMENNNGNTALHVAVSNGHLDVTRVLMENGANLCAADASGSTALHIAAKGGYLNIVQYLADSFAPIDMRNSKKETALLVAAAEGYEKIVSVLIKQGAGIGVRDIEGKTALYTATEKGHGVITQLLKDRAEGRILVCSNSHTDIHIATEVCSFEEVKRLVETGIAIDYGDTFGRTALWVAAKSGHIPIIRFLLQSGSCVNIPDCEGVSPIDIAARNGHWEGVDVILMYGPTISPDAAEYLKNQLYEAAELGHVQTVQAILKCGLSVEITNNYGYTPLHVSANGGHKDLSCMLLDFDANVNVKGKDGMTPLILSASNGHVDVVGELLNHGASVHIADCYNCTPLYAAAQKGHVNVVRQLLNHRASVDIANTEGETPLYIAARHGYLEVIRVLLKHGAEVDFANTDGETPLCIAARHGFLEVIRVLLKHGAGVDHSNNDGETPLYMATRYEHVEVCRLLLNHGATVDFTSKRGATPLHIAALNGHMEEITVLLNYAASVDIKNEDGRTPLHEAASKGHVEVVRELLNRGACVDTVNNIGWKPLNTAASKGHVEVVRELLNHGASVDTYNNDGCTPLNAAAQEGHVEVVRELLNRGASVDTINNIDWKPLNTAASNGHVEVVRELLNHGASVDTCNNDGCTPLNAAASKGHVEVVRELLNHGASVDTRNTGGCTPLNAAAQEGHVQVVRELLVQGANVYMARYNGWTPLNEAALNGHVEVVRELLNHGDLVDFTIIGGRTTLYLAATNGHLEVTRELLNHVASSNIVKNNVWISLRAAAEKGHVKIVRELLNHGAAVDVANEDGCTPLNRASRFGHLAVVRELLNHGANVDTVNNNGCTPLKAAAKEGHIEIVRELLNRGASVNIANEGGWTPLNTAVRSGLLEVVRELLNRGASVNIPNERGWTPLNTAARRGYLEVVQELLHHGASVDIANNKGATPLNTAASEGHVECVRIFLNHGAPRDTKDRSGFSPLGAAVLNGHVEIIQVLLNHGAQVDISKEEGWSLFNEAAQRGNLKVIRVLLEHALDENISKLYIWRRVEREAEKGNMEGIRDELHFIRRNCFAK